MLDRFRRQHGMGIDLNSMTMWERVYWWLGTTGLQSNAQTEHFLDRVEFQVSDDLYDCAHVRLVNLHGSTSFRNTERG